MLLPGGGGGGGGGTESQSLEPSGKSLPRLVLGIRSSVGILALPFRPLYNNMSLLSFLLFLRDSHFNCPRMPVILPVS